MRFPQFCLFAAVGTVAAFATAWLDPTNHDPEQLKGLLVPAAPGRLEAYPVSTAVNSVRNNGPELVAPLPPEDERAIEHEVGLDEEERA